MPKIYYNYPWSGRLGRITDCCIYCGESGTYFNLSSHATRCLSPNCCYTKDIEPIPELYEKFHNKYLELAKKWCQDNNMDYDRVIKEYYKLYGYMPGYEVSQEEYDKFTKKI